jgi:hypothetical protein
MARSTMDFAQQNTERAVQATDWMRAVAEQDLNQSKAAFNGLLAMARSAARGFDRQTCAICEHSIAAAEQTLENAFDFAHKVVRIKEPQELIQLQSDFVSRQSQVLGDQAKELGQRMMERVQETQEAIDAGTSEARKRSEAA